MFNELCKINAKPEPFQYYTAEDLWTDGHTSKKMLEFHLDESVDASSRSMNFIEQSVSWIVDYFNLNSSSDLLDLGCGPGLYTNRLAQKGINVTGEFEENNLVVEKAYSDVSGRECDPGSPEFAVIAGKKLK
ncbi:hypothetical protein ACOBQJ_15710 [Pelotomaculum propionicicum]|uniref:hypothetical protein n=1 Tax=Pelotomaculum propionicicum TaxID=258475 RepID=UPI003B7EC6CB